MKHSIWRRLAKLLPVLVLAVVLLTTAALATETTFDTEDFKGLVLTTTVGSDEVSVTLYKGFNNEAANKVEPVYTEETADGGMAYYYEVTSGGKYRSVSRSPSGNARYIIHRSIYISAEEAATKTVTDVTPAKRSTNGWDPSLVYTYTDEVLSGPYNADQSQWPDYADVFTTPSFKEGRNPHQQTTQTEMMNFLSGLDDADDDMYIYIMGKGNGAKDREKFDIPLVIFTTVDLSGAATWEEAAALVKADSEKTGKVMVHYQAHIHGSEPASGEGALAMIQRFDGTYGEKLLEKMNIYVMPRLNPYGAYKSTRNTYYNGSTDTDPNGDFMRLRMVETQLRQKAVNLFDPDVALDGHEYMINMEWASMQHKDVMLASHFLPCHTEEFQQLDKNIAKAAQSKLTENGLSYGWYTDVVNNAGGGVGSGNAAYRGILHILMETHGIQGGRNYYARRVMGQVSVVIGVMDYVYDNAATVRSVVRAQKQAIVDEGKTYEESDQVILEYAKETVSALALSGNNINLATGKLTATTFPANVWQKVVRSRTAPTAYVIPAGESWTQDVLDLMDKHAITYSFIPAGSGMELQQYSKVTLNDSGKITEAALTEENTFSFPKGAYVFSMAQVNGNILSLLAEPDVTQSTTNTLVQSGKIPIYEDGMIPIYRYIRDLNADGSVTYTATAKAPAGLAAQNATSDGVAGKITGLYASMVYEYRLEGATAYTPVAAGSTEINGLEAGTYYIRFAATADSEASAVAVCRIKYITVRQYAVYLQQGAADDTGDGYTEETAVKTVETAYAQLAAIMADAPAGTTGKIILLDTYTLPKGRQDFPAHNFPVEITGKEATNGFSYPGGGGADENIIAFNGDTTISNLTLTLGGSSTYNYLSAMGHKFVVGEGVTGVKNSGDAYFNINGGDYRGTFASTDVTVLSGSWRQIYAGNYASGTISGDVKLKVDGATVTHYIQGTYNCTISGDLYYDLENVGGTSTIYAGATSAGKLLGSATVRLGEKVSQTKLFAGGGKSTVGQSMTVIADGVDLTAMEIYGRSDTSSNNTKYLPATLILKQGKLADVIDTFVVRDDATIVLGSDETEALMLNKSFHLDINGNDVSNISVADGYTVTAFDSSTDDFNVLDKDGKRTYGILSATGNVVAEDGYVVREESSGKSYHRHDLQLDSVSLRPAEGGIYYTGQFGRNELYRDDVESYGVVLSIKDNPKLGKERCEHSTLTTWPENGAGHGTLLTGIMKQGGGYYTNSANAAKKVYGVAYIKYTDGSVEYSAEASFSLQELVEYSDSIWSTLDQDQRSGLLELYGDFKNVMRAWNIPNIKAA